MITVPLVFADTDHNGVPNMDDATRNIGGLCAWFGYISVAVAFLLIALAIFYWVRARQSKG
jgi:large-conductance mechanosensitive channel